MSEDLKAWAEREREDARELDALRDLRALVLRTDAGRLARAVADQAPGTVPAREWQAVARAAAAAVRSEVPR